MKNKPTTKLKKYKKLFVEKFFTKEYEQSFNYYNKFFEIRECNNQTFNKYYEKIQKDYHNLDNLDEEYLIKRANVARCQKQNYLFFSYSLLTLIKNPKCAEIFYMLAKDEYENESVERATKLISEALKLQPDNHSFIYLYAICIPIRMMQENLTTKEKNKLKQEFFKELNKAIELAPNVVDYYLYFAKFYKYNERNYNLAIKYYNKSIEIDPRNSWFYSDRAECHKELGNMDAAIEDYLKSIELDPADHFTYRDLGYLYIDCGKSDKMTKLFNNGIEKFENKPYIKAQIKFGLATLTEYGLNDLETAYKLYNELIEEFPEDMRYIASRATLKNKLKDFNGAIKDCDIVFNSGESDYEYLYVEKGNAMSMLKKYEQAIECFDKVLSVYPDIYPAFFGKGYTLDNMKKYKQALKCYDKAIEIYDEDFSVFINKSNILYRLKKYEQAFECINKAIKLNPDYADNYVLKAMISMEMKNIPQAIKDIKRTQKLDKNNPHAYRLKAVIYYLKKEYKKALKEANNSIKYDNNPENRAEVHYLCYLIYKILKQPTIALQEKELALKELPEFKYRTFTKDLKEFSSLTI